MRRLRFRLLLVSGVLAPLAWSTGLFAAERVLLLSASNDEAAEPALQVALDGLQHAGLATDHLIAAQHPVLTDTDGKPRYTAIVLTSGDLPLSQADQDKLEGYERAFHVRSVTINSVPRAEYGLVPGDGAGYEVKLAAATGADQVLPGLTALAPLDLKNSWYYLARQQNPALTQPVLVYDLPGSEKAVAAGIVHPGDGREQLHFFFTQSRDVPASVTLEPIWTAWLKLPGTTTVTPVPDPTPTPVPTPAPAPFSFDGSWNASGTYGGKLSIREGAGAFALRRSSTDGADYGLGLRDGDSLYATWGVSTDSIGIAIYKDSGTGLAGQFRTERDQGQEVIQGLRLADLDKVDPDHDYRLTGHGYSKDVRIRKLAQGYLVQYFDGYWLVEGFAMKSGDRLVVAFGSSEPLALASYRQSSQGGLLGHIIKKGSPDLIEQQLSRVAR